MRKAILLLSTLALLALVNYGIAWRERLLNDGRIVLLELAPVDPRSLMQGDYMALRFFVATDARKQIGEARTGDGRLVLRLDADGVAHFRRLDRGEALAADEVRMRYRQREHEIKLATNAFFFEEGSAPIYRAARYGEFRVGPDGEALLTALRDQNRVVLGPARGR